MLFGGWGACTEHAAQLAQFQVTGIISGTSTSQCALVRVLTECVIRVL